ncbi:MAG TPA: ABC transporter substrate-binding protein, partial [Bacillota bacterium]
SHGWSEDAVPDPQDPETFRRSKLDWSEPDREPHARLLRWYRDLLALRRAQPDLRDPRLDRVDAAWHRGLNEGQQLTTWKRRRAWLGLVAVLTTLAVMLAACGGGSAPAGDQGAAPGDGAPSGGESPEPAAEGPQPGGTVVIPIVDDPIFNPHHPNHYVESVMVTRVLFNGLTKPGKDLQPSPDLAESWDISDDGLVWTFHLRDGVTWHDGEPFTAEDVRFTFMDIVLNPDVGSSSASNFRNVQEVVAVDDRTVEFHLKQPMASLASYLGYNAGILPSHILKGTDVMNNADFNKGSPVGTGPFKMADYVSGQYVVLERFDDYFGGRPLLDQIQYRVVPDTNTQLSQLLTGELSIMIVEQASNVERLENEAAIRVDATPQLNYVWIAPNTTKAPFDDARVRQALSYALDRPAMIQNILRGYGRPATGPISPALEYYYNPDVTTYPYDPERAKELLAEAGWEDSDGDGYVDRDGQTLEIALTVPKANIMEPLATLAQQYFESVGVKTNMDAVEFNVFVADRLVPRSFDIMVGWWITPPDPDIFAYYHSSAATGGNNVPMYANSELDALLEQGQAVGDPAQRKEAYDRVQEILADEVPYIFVWYPDEIVARRAGLEGVPAIGFRDALQYAHEWYWTEN